MQRWIARLLVLVMAVPALGPLAIAAAAPQTGPHCARPAAKPAMQCHPGMTMPMPMAADTPSSEKSFRATDSCCQDHDCCRGMAAPKWAASPAQLLLHWSLPVAAGLDATTTYLNPGNFVDDHSARAPPFTLS
jgi:hypothetical protein